MTRKFTLFFVLLIVGLFLFISPSLSLSLWLSRSTIAAQATRPNIVVILTDDQDVASLPVMRHLMAYPGGSWVHFTNAFANTALCAPARSTLLTGQYAHHHGVLSNAPKHIDRLDTTNTLPVWLDAAGYRTAMLGKYGELGTSPQAGWDVWQVYTGPVDPLTTSAVSFIEANDAPFFLYVSYHAPHMVARPPARYENADVYMPRDARNYMEANTADKPRWIRELPIPSLGARHQWRIERTNAHREILAIDDGVQAIIAALQARGQLDNTMIVFVSDNGFSWGSHRWFYKNCAYDECSRVPLLIRYPGQVGNRLETRLVSHVNLAATIAEYAGVAAGRPQDGASLIPLLRGTAASWEEAVLLERRAVPPTEAQYWGVRLPGWHYVEYDNGDRELYNMTADPFQQRNRAGRRGFETTQAYLAGRLAALIE